MSEGVHRGAGELLAGFGAGTRVAGYMPEEQEQIEGNSVDGRADQNALACAGQRGDSGAVFLALG